MIAQHRLSNQWHSEPDESAVGTVAALRKIIQGLGRLLHQVIAFHLHSLAATNPMTDGS
jgi:hypothetical protein